jgi:hypothetical protein
MGSDQDHDDMLIANAAGPYVGFGLGDDLRLSIPYSMALTLLAAFLERPFITVAGLPRGALVGSIRANVVSWGLGLAIAFGLMLIDDRLAYELFPVLLFASVPASILVEGWMIGRMVNKQDGAFRWLPIVLGNLYSAGVLILITFVGSQLSARMEFSLLVAFLRSCDVEMQLATGVACLSAFIVAFAIPLRRTSPRHPENG